MRYVDLGAMNALNEKNKSVKKKSGKWKFYVFLLVVFLLVAGAFNAIRRQGFTALLNPVSIVSSAVNPINLKQDDGRTNILILGLDRRADQKVGGLTDTILIGSIGTANKDAALISIPRDLWVKRPTTGDGKINSTYAFEGGLFTGDTFDSAKGANAMAQVVQEVLGIPIHYYVVIDFQGFEKVIDILGGIQVNVDNAFEDFQYPIEGKENAPENERYLHIKFNTGLQTMDAATALEYARSRHGNNGEGSDFARAKRQQKVILAVWDKLLSLGTLSNPSKLKDLYDTYVQSVDTNIGLGEAQRLYEVGHTLDLSKIKNFVIDNSDNEDTGGLLYVPADSSLYAGQYVLIPKAGDYSQIHAHIQKLLFGGK